MTIVPTVATPVSPAILYGALRVAWVQLLGTDPTRQSLLLLIGHAAFETGWMHECWCWNLGNVKHVAGDGHDYYQIRCNEFENGKWVWYDPPSPKSSFRSFSSLVEGVAAHLKVLHGQFGYAWPYVETGDAGAFCHALRERHYYTDPEADYTRGVVACIASADHVIPPDPDPAPLAIAAEGDAIAGFVPDET